MAYNVIDIANKIIASTDTSQGDLISNLKLQKLLYYCQGFFLAATGERLFDNSIEAWQYGPVVSEVYHNFKHFGNGEISISADTQLIELKPTEEALFNEVLDEYAQFSAIKLMNMTHDESPWKNTFPEKPQAVIPDEVIIEYFKNQIA